VDISFSFNLIFQLFVVSAFIIAQPDGMKMELKMSSKIFAQTSEV